MRNRPPRSPAPTINFTSPTTYTWLFFQAILISAFLLTITTGYKNEPLSCSAFSLHFKLVRKENTALLLNFVSIILQWEQLRVIDFGTNSLTNIFIYCWKWVGAFVAQGLEHWSCKPGVESSNLSEGFLQSEKLFSMVWFLMIKNIFSLLSLQFSKSAFNLNILETYCSQPRGLGGATVARLTPDQKVACSNHVRVRSYMHFFPSPLL